jgi:hypothetical protein
LKNTLENKAPTFVDAKICDYINARGRNVLVVEGVSRWGLSKSFAEAGYETIFGDFMFGLGLPIAIRKLSQLKMLAHLLLPVVSRLPFEWIYPTGEKQEKRTPKWGSYYAWATVIAGDCHYIKRFMPDDLTGKVIVTNTTTSEDVEAFRKAGVKYLVTTTPVLEGRSFGTNMMEAALIAVSGKGRPLTLHELDQMIETLAFEPHLQELN